MTPEIVPGSNAYVFLEEAEAYMATLAFKEDWDKATDAKKRAALIQAARWMNTLAWRGRKGSQAQPLAWPREGAVDPEGFSIPDDEVPAQVKEANAEFALRLLSKDRAGDAKKGVSVSGIVTHDEERELVPQSVRDLLGCLLMPSAPRLERG